MDIGQLQEFATNHILLVAALAVVAVLLVANELVRLRRGYGELTPGEAVRVLNQPGAVVVDIRSGNDHLAGHIIGARNLSLTQLTSEPNKVSTDKEAPVLVYCANGTNSGRTAAVLAKAGFSHVNILKGGLAAWRADNFPVESRKKNSNKGEKKSGKKKAPTE